jgi:beta-alanine--pyruvate transaminase
VGGLVNNRRVFPTLAADHMPHTLDLARNAFSRGLPDYGVEKADELERIVALHGADTIAAVIVEPVSGSAGVLPPPKGYLERLRALCDKHGLLLIYDEVITGFGRLGAPFASQYFGVKPDIYTTAKGITNAAVPMGAVFARRDIHDALMGGPENIIELFHGYTYSGHPAACAAGLATLDIYERDGLLTRAAEIGPWLEDAVHAMRGKGPVIDIRNIGLMAAVEFEPRPGAVGARGYEAMVKCFEAGLMVRGTGDVIAFSPPLIISKAEITKMFEIFGAVAETLH